MATVSYLQFTQFSFVLMLFTALLSANANQDRKVHIVYMGEVPSYPYDPKSLHHGLLDQVLENISPEESLVYSYKKSIHGFAAKLTTKEKERLAEIEGVVSVFPSNVYKPQTTRSWDFLKFPQNVTRHLQVERDVIIGVLDYGIWPESESFNDKGLGPPPAKWKGTCVGIKCNNKIIGARYYNSNNDTTNIPSPRDYDGHGTHAASTVAGQNVKNVSLYGLAGGTARGGVPSARLAIYKVCWPTGCPGEDVLAAFDDAIADGVDIISISLGVEYPLDYFNDSIAIGSFHAMKKGILTSASGGNYGPNRYTLSNSAPWMIISAASSTDRRIIDKMVTGDKRTITGVSINTFPTESNSYPFIYLGDGSVDNMDCFNVSKSTVEGKIVLCGSLSNPTNLLNSGAKGAVMFDDFNQYRSWSYSLPAIQVSYSETSNLVKYIDNTKNPVANIHKSEEIFDKYAPVIGSFSSRGPNTYTPNILKPDISAPGIEIIAAWSPNASMSDYPNDTRIVEYNIISGTSMACPHTTAAAAYVKSFHPDWSPAALMSALMTTASSMNPALHADAEFSHGAGLINPVEAVDPGLIYDASEKDYLQMLCSHGYNDLTLISIITGDNETCKTSVDAKDLNYPSMAYYAYPYKPFTVNFTRTVTNVGNSMATYTAKLTASPYITVNVKPKTLSFKKLGDKQQFVVTVSGGPFYFNTFASVSISWYDGKHSVRSPIVIYTDLTS